MNEQPNLDETRTDVAVATATALGKLGISAAIPYIGPVVAEIVGTLIPNQRMSRVTEFLEILDGKLSELEEDVRKQKMKTEEFIDLFEDSVWQAARALTRERKEQIAAFLRYSLYHGELDHIQEKTLLSLLNQLNNAQIIMLKSYTFQGRIGGGQAYFERHQDVLVPPTPVIGAPEEDIDREALHKAYRNELQRLGLIEPKFKKPKKGELPEFDTDTGMVKAQWHRISWLGRLLLRYIELEESGEDDQDED